MNCRPWILVAVALAVGLGISTGTAYGQRNFGRRSTNPYLRPPTSPYLNLLRNDIPFGFNYFRSVRPEFEFRRANVSQSRSLQNIRRQVERQGRALRQSETSGLGPTGHQAYFLNYGGYFNIGPAGGGAGGGGAGFGGGAVGGR